MSPQPGLKIDWEELAWDHGFKGDDGEMFSAWYNRDRLTMVEIGERIDVCSTTVSRRMRELGIKLDPKRNANCGRGPRLPGSGRRK
jgi:hypothetical protein